MSRLRANQITNQTADGAPTVQNGLIISGVTTSIQHQSTNINVTGVITATSFVGDGSGLIGVASTDNIAVSYTHLTLPTICSV